MSRSLVLLSLCACSGSSLEARLQKGDGFDRVECLDVEEGAEGAYLTGTATSSEERASCSTAWHAVGGAAGATGILRVDGWGTDPFTIEQRDWNGDVLAAIPGLTAGAEVELTVPFSGEHPVVLVPEGFDGGGPYTVSWSCTSGCDATFGRYPLFMMHGMGTLGPDDGLSRYTAVLKANGYVAHAPRVDPFHGTAFRTERWREHFDAWREGGTFRRVHVIAHSMGGIDARNLATHGDPDHRIQTLTTLGTPHRGSPVADLTLDVFEAGVGQQTLEWAADRLAALLTDGSSDDQDLTTQLVDLSTSGMEAFNEVTPDRDDVVYRSWLGVTCGWLSFGCQSMFSGEVASWELHPILPFIEDTSDGLVTFDSAVWGEVQGVFAADHMDLNGSGGPTGHFDSDGFILREAARLVAWENGEEGPIEEQAFSLAETRAWFED